MLKAHFLQFLSSLRTTAYHILVESVASACNARFCQTKMSFPLTLPGPGFPQGTHANPVNESDFLDKTYV